MLQSLSPGLKQRINDSDSTKCYERRVTAIGGSINTVTHCALSNTEILRVWIPNSIIFLNGPRSTGPDSIGKKHGALKSIVFESNSRLTQIELGIFSYSSLESILIPRNVEILGSICFLVCQSLSSITFESHSQLKRIESEAFSSSSLQSILIPKNVEILGSNCFSYCHKLSSIIIESNSCLTRIELHVFSFSSLESIVIPRNVQFIDGSAFLEMMVSSISIEFGNDIFVIENGFLIDIVNDKLI
jgi:hypothetical protein